MKVVLDTCILVAAARSKSGASHALLRKLPDPGFQICLSVRLPETIPMSTLTLQIPDGILSAIQQSAAEAGVSVDQFVASAAGEKLASWRSLDWLRAEAAQGNRSDFERFLGAVPEQSPIPGDEIQG